MLLPCSPQTHDVRTTAASGPASRSPASFVTPVHRLRVRRVVLAIRAIERAVEHVVGADVDEMGADLVGGRRDVADGVGVDRAGDLDVRLARVDGGVRRGVDDGVGPSVARSPTARRRVGDVERGVVDAPSRRHPLRAALATTSWPSCPPAPVTNSLTVSPSPRRLQRSQAGFGLQRLPPVAVARGTTRRSRRASRRRSG